MKGDEVVSTAVVSARAAQRLKELGTAAAEAVEELRQELEGGHRIGVRRDAVPTRHGGSVYKTWLEPRPGMPGLSVAYLYIPRPLPPVAVIIAVVPEDPAEQTGTSDAR